MSGAVEGVALPDGELIYQALRFLFWSAGQGVSPINTDDAPDPEEVLWQYSLRTGDEEWETVAERYRASLTTPPARSYADGVQLAFRAGHRAARIRYAPAEPNGPTRFENVDWEDAAIRLLSQGWKA